MVLDLSAVDAVVGAMAAAFFGSMGAFAVLMLRNSFIVQREVQSLRDRLDKLKSVEDALACEESQLARARQRFAEAQAMILRHRDWVRVHALLRKTRHGGLTARDERDLRRLLARESPRAATLPRDELVHLGMVLIGLYAVVEEIVPWPGLKPRPGT